MYGFLILTKEAIPDKYYKISELLCKYTMFSQYTVFLSQYATYSVRYPSNSPIQKLNLIQRQTLSNTI